MKTNILKSVLLLTVASASSFAQDLRVTAKIPFAFEVSGTTLPAGDYVVSSLNGSNFVLLISDGKTNGQVLALAHSLDTMPTSGSSLVFTTGKETAVLSTVKVAGRTFELAHSSTSATGPLATATLPGVAALRRK